MNLIFGNNNHKILLEFYQPSKLTTKGRCAAGLEKGFLYLELDKNANLIKSNTYLTESCLWSIEIISILNEDSEVVTYICDNLQNSETYIIKIDTKNVILVQEDNN